ncbi:HD family phosphohydrolase [Oceanospirillum linum]|uniref:Phosphohydrolase n=1 Tax=Oceanospirillum linum TaxID=966 RepID=A0A1T1HE69_OCELI|nr:HD family phosphohydrolase [Oceanospirillum linum]OOV88106.1 phosphohydrolase [Oceanospirillum linum]SEF43330.1 HD-GYP domain, c-di-GMP phosphodiesterase class II (or its inactivated variant) [Oleiphilus messinensis]SMP01300.1 HD-GYP domain, c-di-GMP phosphodiesterase class II (or its inactivated variant) [Oceanospirillum linum]
MQTKSHETNLSILDTLNEIGIALSAEKDMDSLLERILINAKMLTGADGGTLYLYNNQLKALEFCIVRTDSLGIKLGGKTGAPISDNFRPLPLYLDDGTANEQMIAAYAALHKEIINIEDAYTVTHFDFSGTRKFDESTGYRSKSFLTIPMTNHENDIMAVLQLLNKVDEKSGDVIPFSLQDQKLAESLASQAAVALTNKGLIDEMQNLFDAFIKLIATAIDEKSPHTGNHCRRVPEATMMIAEAAHRSGDTYFSNFTMDASDRYELKVASWLHDCGKITTPVHVVEKATKLETIHDRIELVAARFEILRRDHEIAMLKQRITALEKGDTDHTSIINNYETLAKSLAEDLSYVKKCNTGGEFMTDDQISHIDNLSQISWTDMEGTPKQLITDNERYNLTIRRGTITAEERETINNHMSLTIRMLEQLPFPKHLKNVPEYAGGHHERMDGKGYPRGLTRNQMSIPARIMAVADVFEALTSSDRPYKKAMPLSQTLNIMGRMVEDNHLDPDIFRLFVESEVYLKYAEKFLKTDQIDEIDVTKLPGITTDTSL